MAGSPTSSRRAVLASGAGAVVALAGCGTARPSAGPPTGGTPSTATTTTAAPGPPPGPMDWAGLAAALTGTLVLPGAAGYTTAVQLWDPRFDGVRPQGVAYCATPTDVQRCVGFARDHGVAVAVRSGGHSYAGYSTGPGLVVDVTRMATVSVGGGTATVGAGARLVDVYAATNAAGMSVPAGSCPTVGLAGLALGGGAGVVGRAQGLTCDHVTSVTVVTADGRLVTADAGTNEDLYWACRGGGGGNFGVVTGFELSTFATQPVARFSLSWDWSAADQVVPAYLAWAPAAPDPLWANLLLSTDPSRPGPTVEVGGVWLGSAAGVAPLLAGLQAAAGRAAAQVVATDSFAHAMLVEAGCADLSVAACRLPSQGPQGALTRRPSLARSDYLTTGLPPAGVAALLAGIDQRRDEGGLGACGLDSYGGAINRVAPAATAFVHRDTIASIQYNADFAPGDASTVVGSDQAWLDSWWGSMRPHVSGQAYQNYIDPLLPDWQSAYYGANLPRLEQVKAHWDPDDVWHFAQSIPLP